MEADGKARVKPDQPFFGRKVPPTARADLPSVRAPIGHIAAGQDWKTQQGRRGRDLAVCDLAHPQSFQPGVVAAVFAGLFKTRTARRVADAGHHGTPWRQRSRPGRSDGPRRQRLVGPLLWE